MPPGGNNRTPADLVADLRAYGMSVTEIAAELQRSPRMVRKIVRGETRGEAYRTTLTELVDKGVAQTRPPRRRGRDGQTVRVRAPRASGVATRHPDDPGTGTGTPPATDAGTSGTPTQRPTPATQTTYLAGGARQYAINVPRTGPNREAGRVQIMSWLRAAARGQRGGRKNARFTLNLKDGRSITVGGTGGYAVSAALARSKAEGNDPFAWLNDQIQGRYEGLSSKPSEIVGVAVTIY